MTVFSPDAVAAINRAYQEACNVLAARGLHHLKDQLADRVMSLARGGETDEERLCSLALLAVVGRETHPSTLAQDAQSGRDEPNEPLHLVRPLGSCNQVAPQER